MGWTDVRASLENEKNARSTRVLTQNRNTNDLECESC